MLSELQVGVITQTHGIRGEVKVFPTTDDVNRFKKLKEVILDNGKERLAMKITGVKFFKQYAILKFDGYDSINDIEKYKGAKLFVSRENAVKLQKGEYFVADLIGMRVVTEDGEPFGILKDVLETGANDVYVVETQEKESGEKKEVLLPAIKECVLAIDQKTAVITVHIMEGLL
ncbi:MAG: ribosome maturation factor RimM [Roseburia sp.]|nr:ribosome maturation factor RimM [Ruminococcus sp.]MCM1155989.1 ribosome maturation factor RimM [Roseburia sp.]MCM1242783.1 ribosome maturation factor RimM [Roseburia sp.]